MYNFYKTRQLVVVSSQANSPSYAQPSSAKLSQNYMSKSPMTGLKSQRVKKNPPVSKKDSPSKQGDFVKVRPAFGRTTYGKKNDKKEVGQEAAIKGYKILPSGKMVPSSKKVSRSKMTSQLSLHRSPNGHYAKITHNPSVLQSPNSPFKETTRKSMNQTNRAFKTKKFSLPNSQQKMMKTTHQLQKMKTSYQSQKQLGISIRQLAGSKQVPKSHRITPTNSLNRLETIDENLFQKSVQLGQSLKKLKSMQFGQDQNTFQGLKQNSDIFPSNNSKLEKTRPRPKAIAIPKRKSIGGMSSAQSGEPFTESKLKSQNFTAYHRQMIHRYYINPYLKKPIDSPGLQAFKKITQEKLIESLQDSKSQQDKFAIRSNTTLSYSPTLISSIKAKEVYSSGLTIPNMESQYCSSGIPKQLKQPQECQSGISMQIRQTIQQRKQISKILSGVKHMTEQEQEQIIGQLLNMFKDDDQIISNEQDLGPDSPQFKKSNDSFSNNDEYDVGLDQTQVINQSPRIARNKTLAGYFPDKHFSSQQPDQLKIKLEACKFDSSCKKSEDDGDNELLTSNIEEIYNIESPESLSRKLHFKQKKSSFKNDITFIK